MRLHSKTETSMPVNEPTSGPPMAMPESDTPVPQYTPVQEGKTAVLSVSQGCIITAEGREVGVLPWENRDVQKWKIEMKDGRYAFRNIHSGMLLGLHFFGNVVAGVPKINEWELFTLDPVDGGYKFTVHNYWLWSTGALLRPTLTNRLTYSSEGGSFSPINIEYVECW